MKIIQIIIDFFKNLFKKIFGVPNRAEPPKTNLELIERLKNIAKNYETVYVTGRWGHTARKYRDKYAKKYPDCAEDILAASTDAFYFDCSGLIKGVMWGWDGNHDASYGGAGYAINGVADTYLTKYVAVRDEDFSNIEPGELLIMSGHVGLYIGDGLGIECTPKWEGGVQITAVGNIGKKAGYNTRTWLSHGKLSFIEYVKQPDPEWPKTYVVQKGDTLSGIANKFYGHRSKKYYMYIAEANGIENPSLIRVGQVLTIPEWK